MILITGGNGRIGNVVVRELNKRNERPKVLVRKGSDLRSIDDCDYEEIHGDIMDPVTLEDDLEGVTAIFHLAGYINISPYYKELTYNTNVQGTKNIIYLCEKYNLDLLYTSSIHAISAPSDGSLITEETPFCTETHEKRGLYDCSKARATRAVIEANNKGLRSLIFHPTGVIGPYDHRPSQFGTGMIKLIKSDIKMTIDGKYDYVDVRDVAETMIKAYEEKRFGERYILSNRIMSMGDYAKYLHEFSGIKGETSLIGYWPSLALGQLSVLFSKDPQITPYSVKTLHSNCNISHAKASKELGYSPRSVKESIHDQYEWFKENGYLRDTIY